MKYWSVVEKLSVKERDNLPLNLKLDAIDSFMKSTVWKNFRSETIHDVCDMCGADEKSLLPHNNENNPFIQYAYEYELHSYKYNLHLHHIKPVLKYFGFGFKAGLKRDEFLTLCPKCHSWVHKKSDAREREMLIFKDLFNLSKEIEHKVLFHNSCMKQIDIFEQKVLTTKAKMPKKGVWIEVDRYDNCVLKVHNKNECYATRFSPDIIDMWKCCALNMLAVRVFVRLHR